MEPSTLATARTALGEVIQGISNPRIKRTLRWIDRLLVLVDALREATAPEGTRRPSGIKHAMGQVDRGTMSAATAYLKESRYPGEAARNRSPLQGTGPSQAKGSFVAGYFRKVCC